MAVAPDTHGQTNLAESEHKLTMSDLHDVCQSLNNLVSPDVRRLGLVLGLLYPTLEPMMSLDQMVAAWLNRQDDVLSRSGEPTWSRLADALREIGQTGLAEDIKRKSHSRSGDHVGAQINSSIQTDTGVPATPISEETREDLYQRIMMDLRMIKLKFSALEDQIWKSINDIQGLVQLVLDMGILSEDDEEQIRKTPSNVRIILTKYRSFLDFEILELIVERQCSSVEKRMVKEYKEEVRCFFKRRVSEIPCDSQPGSGGNDPGMKKLCVTLILDDPSLERIERLSIIIANILGCHASELVLRDIHQSA